MRKKTFDNAEVNKKTFHASKQTIALNFVYVNQTLISNKFENSDKGFKYFIGYTDDNTIRALCITLPQISGYIKYFDNGGKKVFMISIFIKYESI